MKRIPMMNPEIIVRNIEGEAVLLDPVSGRYFGLNPVGYSFWEKIDGSRDLEQIIEMMLLLYNVEKSIIAHDILELSDNLVRNGLITWK